MSSAPTATTRQKGMQPKPIQYNNRHNTTKQQQQQQHHYQPHEFVEMQVPPSFFFGYNQQQPQHNNNQTLVHNNNIRYPHDQYTRLDYSNIPYNSQYRRYEMDRTSSPSSYTISSLSKKQATASFQHIKDDDAYYYQKKRKSRGQTYSNFTTTNRNTIPAIDSSSIQTTAAAAATPKNSRGHQIKDQDSVNNTSRRGVVKKQSLESFQPQKSILENLTIIDNTLPSSVPSRTTSSGSSNSKKPQQQQQNRRKKQQKPRNWGTNAPFLLSLHPSPNASFYDEESNYGSTTSNAVAFIILYQRNLRFNKSI
eukprot:UN03880